ncbi:hypothetical protein B4U79_11376, partial [Dinothrombium tinctorium]
SNAEVSAQSTAESDEQKWLRFEEELNWCLQTLRDFVCDSSEHGANNGAKAAKLAEANRVLRTLQNPKTAFIKKRQLMSNYFGDYRRKMKDECAKFEKLTCKLEVKNCLRSNSPLSSSFERPVFRKVKAVKNVSNNICNRNNDDSREFRFNFAADTVEC